MYRTYLNSSKTYLHTLPWSAVLISAHGILWSFHHNTYQRGISTWNTSWTISTLVSFHWSSLLAWSVPTKWIPFHSDWIWKLLPHVSWIIMNLKVLLYPKKPSFSFLSSLYLTIKRRRFILIKFIPRAIPMVPLSLFLARRRAWIPTCFFEVRLSTSSPYSSSGTTLTAFEFDCTLPKVYLS